MGDIVLYELLLSKISGSCDVFSFTLGGYINTLGSSTGGSSVATGIFRSVLVLSDANGVSLFLVMCSTQVVKMDSN